jgi:hypothetical protein
LNSRRRVPARFITAAYDLCFVFPVTAIIMTTVANHRIKQLA